MLVFLVLGSENGLFHPKLENHTVASLGGTVIMSQESLSLVPSLSPLQTEVTGQV